MCWLVTSTSRRLKEFNIEKEETIQQGEGWLFRVCPDNLAEIKPRAYYFYVFYIDLCLDNLAELKPRTFTF